MASMGGVVNTFSTQTSMAAPEREAGRIYSPERYNPKRSAPFVRVWHPRRFCRDVPDGSSGSRDRLASPACSRQAAAGRQVDPSPRLRLGTFNGRRPTRESLIGNGGGAPPVSRFLYRPHYRRIKSESQGISMIIHLTKVRLHGLIPSW